MKDKGFTLVELLATMVILAILIFVGTMTVSNIFDNSKDNYYKSLENTLSIAGNEYFNDNREDKPIDDYNFVDMDTLVSHEYMEELKTFDGKETCKSETGVFIYNDSETTGYEVCLVCGDYKSGGDFCNGKKLGTINITGNINDPNGPVYNPLLSYSGTKWVNAGKVYIHFNLVDEGVHVSNYKIYNSNNSFVGDCASNSSNYCRKEFQSSGSYYVEAYDGPDKVANRKYFNIKIDNVPPTMDLKNLETNFLLPDDKIVIDYENEVINIHDDNGYKEVKYTLTRSTPNGPEYIARDKDIKESDLIIKETLQSGKYDLYVTVTDFAGNVATQSHTHIEFYIKYKVTLQYFDRNDNKHDVGNIKVYTYGKYTDLPGKVNLNNNPQEVSWYTNANMIGTPTTSTTTVEKTTSHVLYGKEDKLKVSFGITCNNLTYNGKRQALATIPQDEQGKYRLMVYYGGTLMANEAKDARTYTVVAMLNPGYTWADGTTKAKAKQCTIKPYSLTKPKCITGVIFSGGSQRIVNDVDKDGKYILFGETAYSLDKKPFGVHAMKYKFTASVNSNKNFAWGGTNFNNVELSCSISPRKIPKPGDPCEPDLVYTGKDQMIVKKSVYSGLTADGGGGFQHTFKPFSSDEMPSEGAPIDAIDYHVGPMLLQYAAYEYPVVFALANDGYTDFTWSDGSVSDIYYTCEIKPAPITLKWDTATEYAYDGEEHPPIPTANLSAFPYDDEMTIEVTTNTKVGSHTAVAKCVDSDVACDNFTITNPKKDYEIVDKEGPTCKLTVSNGAISFSASDNYGLKSASWSGASSGESTIGKCEGKTSISGVGTIERTGKVTCSVKDCSGNPGSDSITIKKQKSTATCKTYSYGSTCVSWGPYGSYDGCNFYSNMSNNTTTSCQACGDGSKYECKYRSCNAYNKTGCSSWNDWGGWVDDNNCSEYTESDYSKKYQCRYATG